MLVRFVWNTEAFKMPLLNHSCPANLGKLLSFNLTFLCISITGPHGFRGSLHPRLPLLQLHPVSSCPLIRPSKNLGSDHLSTHGYQHSEVRLWTNGKRTITINTVPSFSNIPLSTVGSVGGDIESVFIVCAPQAAGR